MRVVKTTIQVILILLGVGVVWTTIGVFGAAILHNSGMESPSMVDVLWNGPCLILGSIAIFYAVIWLVEWAFTD